MPQIFGDFSFAGTVLDEELKALMFRRQTSDELMKVNKLVKLCTRHGKELGLFCRRCKEPLCITCSDEEKHDKHKSDITHLSGFYSYFYRYTEMKTEKKLSSLQSSSAVGQSMLCELGWDLWLWVFSFFQMGSAEDARVPDKRRTHAEVRFRGLQ